MGYDILLVMTALLFYFLGRYAGREVEIVKKVKRVLRRDKVQAGVIDYPSQEELDYKGSEQEKIDHDMTRAAREAGLPV